MIKPDAVARAGEILDKIHEAQFTVCNAKMVSLSRGDASKFYGEHEGKPFFEKLLGFVTGGPVIAMELLGTNSVSRFDYKLFC